MDTIDTSKPLALFDQLNSEYIPVEFVKITSKDNIQVRVPETHWIGQDDPLRIFRRDGTHYRDDLPDSVLVNHGETTVQPQVDVDVDAGGAFVDFAALIASVQAAGGSMRVSATFNFGR